MVVGALRLDLLLGDVRSLKQKRSVVRPNQRLNLPCGMSRFSLCTNHLCTNYW